MKVLSTAVASDFTAKVGKREKVEVEGLAYQFLSWQDSRKSTNYTKFVC